MKKMGENLNKWNREYAKIVRDDFVRTKKLQNP